ncbi:MAG: zinc ABC transporter substrate-binding protein [Anaerohalosphaeraceae bacterium]
MNSKNILLVLGLILLPIVGCRQGREDKTSGASIAVTNTYLLSAVRDLTDGMVPVFCLSEPGMCPGHFDLSPDCLQQLRNSRVLLRFDFQSGLEKQLQRMNLPIRPIEAPPGLCIPQTYLQVCRQVCEALEASFPEHKALLTRRMAELELQVHQAAEQIQMRMEQAGLRNQPVLASRHQAEFARWLGLNVVGMFRSADQMNPAEIADCLEIGRRHQVRLLLANRQEGTGPAERMAAVLGARAAVLSNFPSANSGAKSPFFQMLETNLETLLP